MIFKRLHSLFSALSAERPRPKHYKRISPFPLLPFAVFIGSYILLSLLYPQADNTLKLTGFPIFACLLALFVSTFTFKEKVPLKKKVKIFITGASQDTVLYMCFIFIFSSIFAHILTLNGGVDAAIKLCEIIIPQQLLLPGIFTAIALFALTIGSSIGSIATFMPIAVGLSQKLNINPALISGIVVGGSMLGDNLSVISDTTIAAIHTTHCSAYKKFKANAFLAFPAFLITIGILSYINGQLPPLPLEASATTWQFSDAIKVIPYAAVLLTALVGVDVLVVLPFGALLGGILGIFYEKFTFLDAVTFCFDGFYLQKGMVAMLILVLLIGGLVQVIEHNGGIRYLLHLFHSKTKTKAGAEVSIAMLVSLLDIAIARNTIAIMIAGPIAQQIGGRFKLRGARIASLLDVFACGIHGLVPYSSQLLLAGAMANLSTLSIIPYLHYQFAILIIAMLSIVKTWLQNKES